MVGGFGYDYDLEHDGDMFCSKDCKACKRYGPMGSLFRYEEHDDRYCDCCPRMGTVRDIPEDNLKRKHKVHKDINNYGYKPSYPYITNDHSPKILTKPRRLNLQKYCEEHKEMTNDNIFGIDQGDCEILFNAASESIKTLLSDDIYNTDFLTLTKVRDLADKLISLKKLTY